MKKREIISKLLKIFFINVCILITSLPTIDNFIDFRIYNTYILYYNTS